MPLFFWNIYWMPGVREAPFQLSGTLRNSLNG